MGKVLDEYVLNSERLNAVLTSMFMFSECMDTFRLREIPDLDCGITTSCNKLCTTAVSKW